MYGTVRYLAELNDLVSSGKEGDKSLIEGISLFSRTSFKYLAPLTVPFSIHILPTPDAHMQPHTIMLTECLTVGSMQLGEYASPFLRQT